MLKYIDDIYDNEITNAKCECENIRLRNYISFIPISFYDNKGSNKFVIKKSQKAKLYLKSGRQLVYYSDSDIIEIIISLNKDVVVWFLKQFINAYKNNFAKFKFSINDKEFIGRGIEYYDENINFITFTDTSMCINELVQIINYIITKDLQYGADNSEIGEEFLKKTLRGYIAVISSIVLNDAYCKSYLSKIDYNLNDKFNKGYFNKKKDLFEDNLFDISKIM